MANTFLAQLQGRIDGAKQAINNNIRTGISGANSLTSVLGGALKQAQSILEKQKGINIKSIIPQPRAQKGAIPIANSTTGAIVMSDGTLKNTPESNRLKVLASNTLAQSNFSPQAKSYLQSLPITYYNKNNENLYGTFNGGNTNRPNIEINPIVFDKRGPSTAVDVLTHEFLHALDANLGNQAPATFVPKGNKSGDSYGFHSKFQNTASHGDKIIMNYFLGGYPDNDQARDVESFAQYAAPKGNKVLLEPAGNTYKDIFTPASQALNYSPVYSSRETVKNYYDNLFKELDKEDDF